MSWKYSLPCTRGDAERMGGDVPELAMLDDPPVLAAREVDDRAGTWMLDAYFDEKPGRQALAALRSLVHAATSDCTLEQLPDEDWVTMSQQAIQPVSAGRFYVHTAANLGDVPSGAVPFRIDAGLAFGTGGHETTAGCLAMLDRLARRGARFDRVADIGTGTGLLAFAALNLWPRAMALASDIDPVSVDVTRTNAAINAVGLGQRPGVLATCVAPGTDHPLIRARAPYDLVIANILAGPLVSLAPDLSAVTEDGGSLILAGLLDTQADTVLRAYRRLGFRLAERRAIGDWPVLRLVKRRRCGWRRPERSTHRANPVDNIFGTL